MEQIKAITFDLDGTLAYGALDNENYKRALIDYLHKIGYSGGSAALNKSHQAMLERQTKSHARNIELRFDLLYYNRFFRIDIVSGVEEMLKGLSEGYKLAIVSNAITNVSRLALQKLDLAKYFDCIILSRDLGVRTPDPEIFFYALRSMWVKSSQAIHVGNSLETDVQGGKNAGMKTVWIKGDEEVMNIQPDFIISKITELPSLF
jgi:HAD superfamily hydrolase (TIGR01549 family)